MSEAARVSAVTVAGVDAREEEMRAKLRKRREELGWSQRELGRRMGTVQARVSLLEGGSTSPAMKTLILWAGALGLGVEFVDESGSVL